jgi:polyribonucleotide nucleotidyltransferase
MAHHRVNDPRSEVKEGDQVLVKVINIDPSGKIRLSRKALIEAPPGSEGASGSGSEGGGAPRRDEPRRDDRGGRDRDRGGRGGPGGRPHRR